MAVEKGEKGAVEVDDRAAMAPKKVGGRDMITLKSSDEKLFELSKEATKRLSKFLKEKISDSHTDGGIQLKKIDSKALEKVVDYFNKHANNSDSSGINFLDTVAPEDLKEWERKLISDLTQDALFDLITIANLSPR